MKKLVRTASGEVAVSSRHQIGRIKVGLLAGLIAAAAVSSAQYEPYRVKFDFNTPWGGDIAPSFADRTYGSLLNQLSGPGSLAVMTPEAGALRLSSSASSPLIGGTTKIAGVRILLFGDNPGQYVLSTFQPFIGGPVLAPGVTVAPGFDNEERRLFEQAMRKEYSPYYQVDFKLETANETFAYLFGNQPTTGFGLNRPEFGGFGRVDVNQSGGAWSNAGTTNPGWNRLRVQLLPSGVVEFSVNGSVVNSYPSTQNVLSNPFSGSLTLEVRHPATGSEVGDALFDNFAYGSDYLAGKIDQGSAPIDLNGVYHAPSSDSAWAATGDRGSDEQVKATSESSTAAESTFTPFSDDHKKPSSALYSSFDDQTVSFKVKLSPNSVWGPGDAIKVVTESTLSGNSVSVSLSVSGGTKTFTIAGTSTNEIIDTSDASEYLVRMREISGSLAVWVTRVDGSEAESTLTNTVTAASLLDVIFVTEITGGADSKASAEISEFKFSQPRNFVALEVSDPYVKTGEVIAYDLTFGNLDQTVGGAQAFLSVSGNQAQLSRTYNTVPFANGFALPNPLHFASGVGAPAPLVQSSGKIGSATFSAGVEGSASAGINATDGGSPNALDTQFYDSIGDPYIANRIDSPLVLIDNTAPLQSGFAATQGVNNALVAPGVQTGLLNLSVQSSDALSGLANRPTIALDFFPAGPSLGDVVLSTNSANGNTFEASYNVPANAPNGLGQIVVSSVDRAGNQVMDTYPINVNTATLTLNVALANTTPNVTRGLEITLGGDGGGNAPIVLTRDVTFTGGLATLVFTSADGIPNDMGITEYQIGVKDPLHTLRSTVPVSGTGNQYSASATGPSALRGGNLNKDSKIDIGDYVVYAVRVGIAVDANTPFPHAGNFRHADITGNGIVDNADFTYISAGFGTQFDDAAPLDFGRDDRSIRTRITVADAVREAGTKDVVRMDLNRDGVITLAEIQNFLARKR